MIDEGYIKFTYDWTQEPLPTAIAVDRINEFRQKLYDDKLIGQYPNGIGFGNISQKLQGDTFVISGTATGGHETLSREHYTIVDQYDIAKNWLHCKGPVVASSESMTHAMFYEQSINIRVVLHVHNKALWDQILFNVPTTEQDVAYGTPEMAFEIKRLFNETDVSQQKVVAMAGHEEGIFTFGTTFEEAYHVLLRLLE